MYCTAIVSAKRSLLLQCTFVALACCILVPGPCSGDDGKEEAFLDAQELVDGWQANYGHIDSFKVRWSRIHLEEKGQYPPHTKNMQFTHHERIQDGRKFFSRGTRSLRGFNDTDDYVNSFDGSIGKDYMRDLKGSKPGWIPGRGTINRGLSGGGSAIMNLLGEFLESVPDYAYSQKEEPRWKVKSTQQYPLGIPVFIKWYNIAVEMDGVLVRPYLESVAGEPCHVLELYLRHGNRIFWLAHEKAMSLGANEYLVKPFTPQALVAAVRRYLN